MNDSKDSEIDEEIDDPFDLDSLISDSPNIFDGRILRNRSSHFYKREIRLYTLSAYNKEEVIVEEHLHPSYAGRLKREFKRQGYRVDLIEESNLTGEVIRTPDIIPDYILNKVSEQPRPNLSDIPLPKIHRKDEFAYVKEARTQKANYAKRVKKVQESIKVYYKESGNLVFAGDFGGAVEFIKNKTDKEGWTPEDWIIYVPEKIYAEIRRRIAQREAVNG